MKEFSPWHDVSLHSECAHLNFVCIVPSDAKPAGSARSNGKNYFESIGWNYGVLPQTCTWAVEQPHGNRSTNSMNGSRQSGQCPVEMIEIGSHVRQVGDMYAVVPLLAFPLSNPSAKRVSWKTVGIAVDDRLAAGLPPQLSQEAWKALLAPLIQRVQQWLKPHKWHLGKRNGGIVDVRHWKCGPTDVMEVVALAHSAWQLMVTEEELEKGEEEQQQVVEEQEEEKQQQQRQDWPTSRGDGVEGAHRSPSLGRNTVREKAEVGRQSPASSASSKRTERGEERGRGRKGERDSGRTEGEEERGRGRKGERDSGRTTGEDDRMPVWDKFWQAEEEQQLQHQQQLQDRRRPSPDAAPAPSLSSSASYGAGRSGMGGEAGSSRATHRRASSYDHLHFDPAGQSQKAPMKSGGTPPFSSSQRAGSNSSTATPSSASSQRAGSNSSSATPSSSALAALSDFERRLDAIAELGSTEVARAIKLSGSASEASPLASHVAISRSCTPTSAASSSYLPNVGPPTPSSSASISPAGAVGSSSRKALPPLPHPTASPRGPSARFNRVNRHSFDWTTEPDLSQALEFSPGAGEGGAGEGLITPRAVVSLDRAGASELHPSTQQHARLSRNSSGGYMRTTASFRDNPGHGGSSGGDPYMSSGSGQSPGHGAGSGSGSGSGSDQRPPAASRRLSLQVPGVSAFSLATGGQGWDGGSSLLSPCTRGGTLHVPSLSSSSSPSSTGGAGIGRSSSSPTPSSYAVPLSPRQEAAVAARVARAAVTSAGPGGQQHQAVRRVSSGGFPFSKSNEPGSSSSSLYDRRTNASSPPAVQEPWHPRRNHSGPSLVQPLRSHQQQKGPAVRAAGGGGGTTAGGLHNPQPKRSSSARYVSDVGAENDSNAASSSTAPHHARSTSMEDLYSPHAMQNVMGWYESYMAGAAGNGCNSNVGQQAGGGERRSGGKVVGSTLTPLVEGRSFSDTSRGAGGQEYARGGSYSLDIPDLSPPLPPRGGGASAASSSPPLAQNRSSKPPMHRSVEVQAAEDASEEEEEELQDTPMAISVDDEEEGGSPWNGAGDSSSRRRQVTWGVAEVREYAGSSATAGAAVTKPRRVVVAAGPATAGY